jgi:hypothetical protein
MIKIEFTISNPLRRQALSPRRRPYITAAALLFIPMLAFASPVTVPNEFADGEVISAEAFNENFNALETSVNDNDARMAALEAGPEVTVRKATATSPRNVSIAFCEADETLTGGGCFLPPENRYDSDFGDYDTYFTGNFPRPMVGLTSVPVAAGTTAAEIRPTAAVDGNIPFPGDIIADDDGSLTLEKGAGWACRPGVIDHDSANGAQSITTNLYESWYFPVKAYAVCMRP